MKLFDHNRNIIPKIIPNKSFFIDTFDCHSVLFKKPSISNIYQLTHYVIERHRFFIHLPYKNELQNDKNACHSRNQYIRYRSSQRTFFRLISFHFLSFFLATVHLRCVFVYWLFGVHFLSEVEGYFLSFFLKIYIILETTQATNSISTFLTVLYSCFTFRQV